MKKFFSLILVLVNINCFSQTSKWFVSFSAVPVVGGPAASLKNQMREQGYDDEGENTFVIFGSGTSHYPRGGGVALLARGGKSISPRKSIYFIAGVANKGTIEGFRAQGWSNGIFGLFAGTYGNNVSVDYTLYQIAAGYMYAFPNSRCRLGFAPSVYLFNYSTSYEFVKGNSHSSVVPGAAFTARVPFGKEKKLFGLELVFETNIAPPVKMKPDRTEGFQPEKASMLSASAGIAFSFRKN
jgi:hypothetical protein